MKNILRVLSCFLILTLLFSACGRNTGLEPQEKKKIGLIVKMSYGYHWGTVKLGADTAASEFNVNIYYNGANDEKDVEGQIKLVNYALDDEKVDALVLAASNFDDLVGVIKKAHNMGVPVIIIDSEVNTDVIDSTISIDNLDAGKKVGNMLVESFKPNNKCNFAIMNFVKGSRTAELRQEGVASVTTKIRDFKLIDIAYCNSDAELAKDYTKEIISRNPDIDAMVALNDIASEGVSEAIEQMHLSGKIKIIAFGSSPNEINYLDNGVIQATIAQNPFSMGYLGVKYAVDALNNKTIPKYVNTNLTIIDKNNMYFPENQKLLFPFVR
jgi:ribose transport system substrate-binding protein